MAKFIYSYDVGDGYTYSATEYVAFESESKEQLATEIMCAVLDFEKLQKEVREKIEVLDKKSEKARQGGHKQSPDYEEYVKIHKEKRELEDQIKYIEIQGKKYDVEVFMYWESDTSKPRRESGYKIRDIEYNIETLDQWFENKR